MDVEADAIIRALFKRNPDAAYRVTMLAMSLAGAQAQGEHAPVEYDPAPRGRGWLAGLFERREQPVRRNEPVIF